MMLGVSQSELVDRSRSLLRVENETELARLVVETACQTLGYAAAAVILRGQAGAPEVRASAGLTPEQESVLRSSLVMVPDTEGRSDEVASAQASAGLDELLAVPLLDSRDQTVGCILLAAGPSGSSGHALLEMFGHAVSVALHVLDQRRHEDERVRLIETQKHQLEALLQASANVHGGLNLDEVLRRIVVSMTTDGGFQRAAVYLRDQDDFLHARAFVGVPHEDMERLRVPLPFAVFADLMRPEMQVSHSFLFDHRRHELPDVLFESLSVPDEREGGPDEWHPLDSLTVPLQDHDGRTIGLISLDEPHDRRFPDLSAIQAIELFAGACAVAVEQAHLYDEIQRLAMTDPLTGLHNRRSFSDALRRELARSEREGWPCSILFCDLDGLKQLNDGYGHDAGDRALQAVAQLFRQRLRESDLAARLGGDEYVILLPGTDEEHGARLADELRHLVRSLAPALLPAAFTLSISVGVAGTSPRAPLSQTELLAAADRALYAAKQEGRDRVRVA